MSLVFYATVEAKDRWGNYVRAELPVDEEDLPPDDWMMDRQMDAIREHLLEQFPWLDEVEDIEYPEH